MALRRHHTQLQARACELRQRLNRSGERLDHLIVHRFVVRSIRFAEPLLQHRVVRVALDLHGQRLPHLLQIFLVAKLAT